MHLKSDVIRILMSRSFFLKSNSIKQLVVSYTNVEAKSGQSGVRHRLCPSVTTLKRAERIFFVKINFFRFVEIFQYSLSF